MENIINAIKSELDIKLFKSTVFCPWNITVKLFLSAKLWKTIIN